MHWFIVRYLYSPGFFTIQATCEKCGLIGEKDIKFSDKNEEMQFIQNYNGYPINIAAQYGNLEVVNLLLKFGAYVNVKEENGMTALMSAAQNGHKEIASLLINNNADLISTFKAYIDVVIALQHNHPDIAYLILSDQKYFYSMVAIIDTPIISDEQDENLTLLMLASKKGYANIVQLLVDNHIDIDVVNESGYTALMYAIEAGQEEIVDILLKARADMHN